MHIYPQHWMKMSGQVHALEWSFLGKSPWHLLNGRWVSPRPGMGNVEERIFSCPYEEIIYISLDSP
jgi:hypothetical protein